MTKICHAYLGPKPYTEGYRLEGLRGFFLNPLGAQAPVLRGSLDVVSKVWNKVTILTAT